MKVFGKTPREAWTWYRSLYAGAWPNQQYALWTAHLSMFAIVFFCVWRGFEASTAWGIIMLVFAPVLAVVATVVWAYLGADLLRKRRERQRSTE